MLATVCILLTLAPVSSSAPFYDEAMMPADDGTLLHTRLHLPLEQPCPVVLGRTPYSYHADENEWSEWGIGFVQQATRGQWDSGGAYDPFIGHDMEDGRTFISWARQQSWSNGRVGIFSGSAKGTMTVLSIPGATELDCFILRPSASNVGDQWMYQGGVYRKGLLDLWLNKDVINAPELEAQWRSRPPSDPWWEQFNVEARSHEVTAPGLHRAGYYDVVGRGTINFFKACQYRGGPGARGNQRLVLLATAHALYEFLEGLAFDLHPNYRDLDMQMYERHFALHYLRDVDDALSGYSTVHYYVVGDDQHHDGPGWENRTALRWPPLPPRETAYYLHPGGTLDTTSPTADSGSASFTFDPDNPAPTLGGQNIKTAVSPRTRLAYGPYDQQQLGDRADVLAFVSPAFTAPVETTGHFRVRLYVSTDAPDTDFTVKLVDVYPDGRAILMLDTIQRLKYRHGLGEPAAPVEPGQIVALDIDLGDIAWVFNTGHRIGLHVSSSNYPRFDVNPNNGDDIPGEHPARVAQNVVHANAVYPSALYAPVRMPNVDTDGDGIPDEAEWDSPDGDMDGDGIPDEEEFYRRIGLDVFNPDTDGDGWTDGEEVAAHTDPLNPESYPGSPIERRHAADTNQDTQIGLDELLRVIQIFNAGGYQCAVDIVTEDGYVPFPGTAHDCAPHDGDYEDGADWRVSLSELLRVIQHFNMGGYYACPEAGTEDGFCPGPRATV